MVNKLQGFSRFRNVPSFSPCIIPGIIVHSHCSFRLVSVRFGSVRFGSVRFGSVRFGSVRFGSVRFGSVRFGSARFGSVRFGSVRFGTMVPSPYGSDRFGVLLDAGFLRLTLGEPHGKPRFPQWTMHENKIMRTRLEPYY